MKSPRRSERSRVPKQRHRMQQLRPDAAKKNFLNK